MSSLWTSDDAAKAVSGQATAAFAVQGLSIDTRSIQPGDMFIALKDRRDGHDFVAQAFEAGAAAALVTHRPEGVAEDAPLLIVEDVLEALRDLARAARARTKAKVIGVTGSVGKTSTKDMLRHVLAGQGRVHAAEKSFNNHWGVPLTLARCPVEADFAVIEIGMNHPGEIAPLAALAQPDIAIVTIVAAAHLAAFDGLDGIAREKAAIYGALPPGGAALINGDLDTSPILRDAAQTAKAREILFGESDTAQWRLSALDLTEGQTKAEAATPLGPLHYNLTSAGRHFAVNALAVLAAVHEAGGDAAKAAQDLGDWRPTAGRGTLEHLALPHGKISLLDDAYNANPTSMGAALEVLVATKTQGKGRHIAILGDMLELGPEEAELHARVADHPSIGHIDIVHAAGPRMAALIKALPEAKRGLHREKAEDLASDLTQALGEAFQPGDVVLVKGSFGSQIAKIVTALRQLTEAEPSL